MFDNALPQRRDDEKIDFMTAKLDSLTKNCRRLSTARHYEMQGLASEVGIMRNDLKMLEHHLACHRAAGHSMPRIAEAP